MVEYENSRKKYIQTQTAQKKFGVVRTVPLELVDAVPPLSSATVVMANTKMNKNLADIWKKDSEQQNNRRQLKNGRGDIFTT